MEIHKIVMIRNNLRVPGSTRGWDSLMTWVTLSNGECPPFFPLEEGIFDLARPLNFRGEKGVAPKQKCRGVHAPIVALLRGKSVTHVIRSCPSRVTFGALAERRFFGPLETFSTKSS